LNVRPGFAWVNQPVPPTGECRRKNPFDTFPENKTICQNYTKQLSLHITPFLDCHKHRKTSRTPLYTGAVVRPGRNNGKPLRAK
jgi:hypothetical protein